MKNREYIIPVAEYSVGSVWIENDPYPYNTKIVEHRMKHYIIERKINNISKKIYNIRTNGKTPKSIIINELDYQFINVYFKYNPNFFIALKSNQVKGPYTLFGLNVQISNVKHAIISWEP